MQGCLRRLGTAAVVNGRSRALCSHREDRNRHQKSSSGRPGGGAPLLLSAAAAGGAVALTSSSDNKDDPEDEEVFIEHVEASRYRKTHMFSHFCSFSSLTYNSEMFMTGQDFLRAVLWKADKGRSPSRAPEIRELTEEQFQSILDTAPKHINEDERELFRNLGQNAVISYPEYLFLVSILSKPRDHFLKTFQMIDIDSNWVLTKEEFETVENMFAAGEAGEHPENTTLKVHFFKMDGSGVITFEDFVKFLDNLQKECLELEFHEKSGGNERISDRDFTELLMSRTTLCEEEKQRYVERVRQRREADKDNSVTFAQYAQFMNLLNDIHELEIALRMFQIAKKPVTPEEFQRAVQVCTGFRFEDRLIELTFKIFDDDGDGHLTHNEFMKVMKDKIRKRGTVKARFPPGSWKAFRKCVHEHMTKTS